MLPSVAKLIIAAFSKVPLPLWLCIVFTAYMFGPASLGLCVGNTACVPKIRNNICIYILQCSSGKEGSNPKE